MIDYYVIARALARGNPTKWSAYVSSIICGIPTASSSLAVLGRHIL